MLPKGPAESRLATMRRARAGPTRGSVSISGSVAVSRSIGLADGRAAVWPIGLGVAIGAQTFMSIRGPGGGNPRGSTPDDGPAGGEEVATVSRELRASLRPLRALPPFAAPWSAAELLAANAWRAMACCSAGVGAAGARTPPRTTRTTPPRRTIRATKARAFCSAGVGMGPRWYRAAPTRHRSSAIACGIALEVSCPSAGRAPRRPRPESSCRRSCPSCPGACGGSWG
jgi:hypothetical protein